MKKISAIILSLAMLVTVVAGCSSHAHTEAENWEADAAGHWKLCEDCGEKTQTGDHSLSDESLCEVCGSYIYNWDDSVNVQTYDEQGNLVRMADYDSNGNLIAEIVNEYEYDAEGHLTKEWQYADGLLIGETEYTVIEGESVICYYIGYYEDGSKFVDEYDENSNLTKLISYDANGNVDFQAEYVYAKNSDGDWYNIASTDFYSDGMKIYAEYDEYDATTYRVIYDADGSVTSTESWEYTYDENGFKTTETAYVDDVLTTQTTYKIVIEGDGMFSYPETVVTYNEDGSKIICEYDENASLVSETKYDASGNVIE